MCLCLYGAEVYVWSNEIYPRTRMMHILHGIFIGKSRRSILPVISDSIEFSLHDDSICAIIKDIF